MHFYGSIQKIDAEQRMVFGYASTEAVDMAGEIVLKSAIEAALDDYLEFANLREMHQLSAVGTTEEASVDDKGLYIGAKVVDDIAWGKVTSGVYKGFSVGGKTLARDPNNKKIITKMLLTEISLVDRPSNPEARFDVWKAAGADDGDDLAKVTRQRDGLAKQLAERDRAIIDLADHLEKTSSNVAKIVKENAELKKQLSDLRAVDNASRTQVMEKKVADAFATLDSLETIVPQLAARLGLLNAARPAPLQHGRRFDA